MQTAGSLTNRRAKDINNKVRDNSFTMQEDYVSFSGLDNKDYLE
jgi:hypothetical protein